MKIKFTLLLTLISTLGFAQAPQDYYTSATGKTNADLKTALYSIISSGAKDKGYDFLYTIYESSDRLPSGKVWDMYSTCDWSFGAGTCGSYKNVCDCYNREHSIPQSWFGSSKPMVSDAFHIYPTDGKVNGQRSNNPFGECSNGSTLSSKALGKLGGSTFPGFSGSVFEPVDEYKGDFARTYFYFATRYENIMKTIGGASFNNSTYPSFSDWTINLFLKWSRQDPVSQKEIDRNNAIYSYQKNRNPYIDYPELAEYVWGNMKGIAWSPTLTTDPQIITPAKNATIDFGNVPVGQSVSKEIDIRAINLEGDINLSLSGSTTTFALSASAITKEQAENGYKLIITCNTNALGTLQSSLNISGGGITAQSVQITANATDSFLALPATAITNSGFTANWTNSVGANDYLLDVYSYSEGTQLSLTYLEEDFASGLPSNWTSDTNGYQVFENGTEMRLASGSKNGSITTPAMKLKTTTTLTVRARSYNNDNGSELYVLLNDNPLTTFITGSQNEDFQVELPPSETTTKITLKANKNRRVFVDYVKVANEGEVAVKVPMDGYPKLVGNVLNYSITGLSPEQNYYYTVTPQGNSTGISNEIQLQTTATSTDNDKLGISENLVVYYADKSLCISNMAKGNLIEMYDIVGNQMVRIQANSDQVRIPFEHKGVFILLVKNGNRIAGSKKLILR